MALSEPSRCSLIPSFLYSSSASSKALILHKMNNNNTAADLSPPPSYVGLPSRNSFAIPASSDPGKIQMYSPELYAACTFGSNLSCGLTHTAITPLDLVKCNMQVLGARWWLLSIEGEEATNLFRLDLGDIAKFQYNEYS